MTSTCAYARLDEVLNAQKSENNLDNNYQADNIYVKMKTVSFPFKGSYQKFTTPPSVTKLKVTCCGASGGGSIIPVFGGLGGCITAEISTAPGQLYFVFVGGKGNRGDLGGNKNGGFNGGGISGNTGSYCGSGGGASDIRTSLNDLHSRVVVGGGGGGYGSLDDFFDDGGAGGGLIGASSSSLSFGPFHSYAATGGSQSRGGSGGTESINACIGDNGELGFGGNAGQGPNGGGGGGGYYGGGGGCANGGGGGSSYSKGVILLNVQGVNTGNGVVNITYVDIPPTSKPTPHPSLKPSKKN